MIVAKNRADSTKLHIEVSPAPRGEYIILYTYACGDDLEKYPRNAELYFVDENGYNRNRITFAMRDKGSVNRTVIAKENNNKLVLNIGKYGNYTSKENKITPPKTQDLKITNLKIMHKYNEVDAVDSLFKRYVDVKIFVDGFLIKKDSLALSADAAGVSTSTASND